MTTTNETLKEFIKTKDWSCSQKIVAELTWQAAKADQAEHITKLELKLEKSNEYINKMDSVIDNKGIIKSCINPLVDLTNSVEYMVKTMTELQADNQRLREALEELQRDFKHTYNLSAFNLIAKALTTPAQSLKEHDDNA